MGDLIRTLARQQADGAVAATLNRLGKKTGRGNAWTEARIRSFRAHHRVPVHRPGEMAERGELTVSEAASILKVSRMTVLRLVASGTIAARQVYSARVSGGSRVRLYGALLEWSVAVG